MFAVIRALIMLTGTVTGVTFGYYLGHDDAFKPDPAAPTLLGDNPELLLSIVLGMFGYLLASIISREIQDKLEKLFGVIRFRDIAAGTIGFLIGLLLANLIILLPAVIFMNATFESVPDFMRPVVPIMKFFAPLIVNLFFGYVGMTVVVKHRVDIMHLFSGRGAAGEAAVGDGAARVILCDTSVLIDGRLVDLLGTGFLAGRLLIPRFVLSELHILSDSADELKRGRGRRGLKITEDLKRLHPHAVEVSDEDDPAVLTVDEKLVAVAKRLAGEILTNDFNLNKVARIQSVRVLNLNELSGALKPIVMPGDPLAIYVLKAGKEPGQGVGYLPDGTMVVVEGGASQVGREVATTVASMIQTSAGRMIFTRVEDARRAGPAEPPPPNVVQLNGKRQG